jgi:methyl-accepting chemotaxis protein
MVVCGVVSNVLDFGAFIDIGVGNQLLLHRTDMIAKDGNTRVSDPLQCVELGQILTKDEIKQLKEALSKMKQQLRDKNKAGGTGTAATPSTPSAPLEQQNTTSENKEEIDKLQKKVKELTETLANQNQVHATEIARLTANVTALQKDSENTLSLLAQSKQQLELKDKQIKTLQETSLTAAANNNNINNVSLRTRRKELIQSALKSPLTPEEEQYTLAIILFVFIILSILI